MDTILVGILGTLLGAVATLASEWFRKDSRLISLPRGIDEASKVISFLDSWCRVLQQIQSLPEGQQKQTALDLSLLVLKQTSARVAVAAEEVTLTAPVPYVLSLLLLHTPPKRWLWLTHIAFYASTAVAVYALTRRPFQALAIAIALGLSTVSWGVTRYFSRRTT